MIKMKLTEEQIKGLENRIERFSRSTCIIRAWLSCAEYLEVEGNRDVKLKKDGTDIQCSIENSSEVRDEIIRIRDFRESEKQKVLDRKGKELFDSVFGGES